MQKIQNENKNTEVRKMIQCSCSKNAIHFEIIEMFLNYKTRYKINLYKKFTSQVHDNGSKFEYFYFLFLLQALI